MPNDWGLHGNAIQMKILMMVMTMMTITVSHDRKAHYVL